MTKAQKLIFLLFNRDSNLSRDDKKLLIEGIGPVDLGEGYDLSKPEVVKLALET